jgi:hypothetical protein
VSMGASHKLLAKFVKVAARLSLYLCNIALSEINFACRLRATPKSIIY